MIFTSKYKKTNGFTLVEIIVVVAIISIFASIALPDLATTVARSSLKDASATTALALRKAKNIARSRNTSVNVNFASGGNSITLTLPDNTLIQSIPLQSVEAEHDAIYRFNSIGTVNQTGIITLQSSSFPSIKRNVTIATLSGQIRVQ